MSLNDCHLCENYVISFHILACVYIIFTGATSEAGGAIAFPVMTLVFSIKPSVARDFSMMLQACGLAAASIVILWMKVRLEWHSIGFCSIGGALGLVFGLEVVDPSLKPTGKKMLFVSIWFSFAFALFLLNRYHDRRTFFKIPEFRAWKALALIFTGFCGGIFTSFAGSGLDICSFSVLTLLFRVSEKVATPTSVVLMAINSMVGSFWRLGMTGGVSQEAFEFLAVCVPIVLTGAPIGSVIGTHFHRLVLAILIYIIDTVSLIGALCIVPQTPFLLGVTFAVIIFGFGIFFALTKLGQVILENVEKAENEKAGTKITSDPEQGVVLDHESSV